ncbi:mitochondrial initiation factor 2 [Tieghemostelium lacteum]|uniref:Mitochondrial initiation factor 2 n=1 Tax=Tieghemostelium lacteum TaxID=361077 RepID=A0A151ZII0_TIELA|nr:mitochondrial initiation factor 2 [Tieghemostelium lacteum]|eukprot:KYQ93654.1 mitochondrial initiation factor 2 [Tieghemostelium lacteum]
MLRINKADRLHINSQGFRYYTSTLWPTPEINKSGESSSSSGAPSFNKLDFENLENKNNNNNIPNNTSNKTSNSFATSNSTSNPAPKFNFNFNLNISKNKPKTTPNNNNNSNTNKSSSTTNSNPIDHTAKYKSPVGTSSQTIFQPFGDHNITNSSLNNSNTIPKNLSMFQNLMKSTSPNSFNFTDGSGNQQQQQQQQQQQSLNMAPKFNFMNSLNLNGGKSPNSATPNTNTAAALPNFKFDLNINPNNLGSGGTGSTLKFNNFNLKAKPVTPTPTPKQQLQLLQLKEEKKNKSDQIKSRQSSEFIEPTDTATFDIKKQIVLPQSPTIESMSQSLSMKQVDLVKWMIKMGMAPLSVKDKITDDMIELMSEEFKFEPLRYNVTEDLDLLGNKTNEATKNWARRSPVVTIVGHIDHGKTSLLDYLRNTTVVSGEAGRITQHIGAFEVKMASTGNSITFMDTPGHAAFSTMRERGVSTTDIALLIVAADDGVQEQTIEAIKAIEKAKVQMIVVINKIDKPGVDVNNIKQQLLNYNIAVEGHGGSVPCVQISAKTGQGITQLEETIILLSEVMDLRAPLTGQSAAVVIESTNKKNRGIYSTILIKKGTIKIGDWFMCGNTHGKIKEMRNHLGHNIRVANPGTPAEIFGFKGLVTPNPGEELYTFDNEQALMEVVESVNEKYVKAQTDIQIELQQQTKLNNVNSNNNTTTTQNRQKDEFITPEQTEESSEEGEQQQAPKKVINIFAKGDFGGNTEALIKTLKSELPYDPEIAINILQSGNGEVTEKDLSDSILMNTPIVYFGPKLPAKIVDHANRATIPIVQGDVIYHVIDGVARYLETQLQPIDAYDIIGVAKVQQVFPINKTNQLKIMIAGCKVTEGKIKRGAILKIKRNDEILDVDSPVDIIKHFKENVKEIAKGQECGVATEQQLDFQVNDTLLAVSIRKEQRKLGSPPKPKYYNKY